MSENIPAPLPKTVDDPRRQLGQKEENERESRILCLRAILVNSVCVATHSIQLALAELLEKKVAPSARHNQDFNYISPERQIEIARRSVTSDIMSDANMRPARCRNNTPQRAASELITAKQATMTRIYSTIDSGFRSKHDAIEVASQRRHGLKIHLGLNGIVWAEMLSQEIWMIVMRSPGFKYGLRVDSELGPEC
ncbi:hypothetical protein BC629DRAFT_1437408 [Irpex lacteus]|nr:hypothetical protein BC629DRAFT_1437408 [Irpex lacteus]